LLYLLFVMPIVARRIYERIKTKVIGLP